MLSDCQALTIVAPSVGRHVPLKNDLAADNRSFDRSRLNLLHGDRHDFPPEHDKIRPLAHLDGASNRFLLDRISSIIGVASQCLLAAHFLISKEDRTVTALPRD